MGIDGFFLPFVFRLIDMGIDGFFLRLVQVERYGNRRILSPFVLGSQIWEQTNSFSDQFRLIDMEIGPSYRLTYMRIEGFASLFQVNRYGNRRIFSPLCFRQIDMGIEFFSPLCFRLIDMGIEGFFPFVLGRQIWELKVCSPLCFRLIDMGIDGFSTTVFCYGQTGSGKTHTLTGPPYLVSVEQWPNQVTKAV